MYDDIERAGAAADEAALLPPDRTGAKAVHDTAAWRALHAASFLLGGTTFIAGTLALYSPAPSAALWSAVLYTVG
jgi:hypothetical protein